MGHLYYNYRDILKAPRLALMGKNIFLMMFHIMLGYIIYLVTTYSALMIDGMSIASIFQQYHLFPFQILFPASILSKLLWYLGLLFWLAFFLRGSLGVARSAFEELRGNFFFSAPEAFRFIKDNSWIVYRAIIGGLLFIGFLILLGIVVGLFGKIPVVGELLYGFFYDFPVFIFSLLAVLVIFLTFTLLLTGPAVVAVKGQDSMTAIFDGFSTITSMPLKWFLYLAGSFIQARVATFILFYFSLRALQFTNWTSGIIMGDKQANLFNLGAAQLFEKFPYTNYLSELCPAITINLNHFFQFEYVANTSWSMSVGGVFVMISLIFIIFLIISYFLNIMVCSQVIAFLDIRNSTHAEKLAFIPDDDLETLQESTTKS